MGCKRFNIFLLMLSVLAITACEGSAGWETGPTAEPTAEPTAVPSTEPTAEPTTEPSAEPTPEISVTSLHAEADFPIGVGVPAGNASNSLIDSLDRQQIVNAHFSQITAENIMKPDALHPAEDDYFWDDAVALVDYAAVNGMSVHGHTLIWHNQIPTWMSNHTGTAEQWTTMMQTHINTIVGRFADTAAVVSWNVVNEAFTDDTPSVYRNTLWFSHIGEDYFAQAFTAARAADEDADLYYNDVRLELNGSKMNRVVTMIEAFKANGTPIDGIGFQMHVSLTSPEKTAIESAFARVVNLGLKVKITEMDVTVNDDKSLSALTLDTELAQAARYQQIVKAYMDAVPAAQRGGISVWGITDDDSGLPELHQRDEWPLLFNANFTPKHALQGFADGLVGDSSE